VAFIGGNFYNKNGFSQTQKIKRQITIMIIETEDKNPFEFTCCCTPIGKLP
jgi:hypothetical protein